MAKSSDAYLATLQDKLPPGIALTRAPGKNLTNLLAAFADRFAEFDLRIDDLLAEINPATAFELLPNWEAATGLPDPCTASSSTIQERRLHLLARLTAEGGQSIAFFTAFAAALGYAITIDEFAPALCGIARCGDHLGGGPSVRYYWRVHVPNPRVTYARCGVSQCGDTLATIQRATDLECLMQRLKPAHTTLIFDYEGI